MDATRTAETKRIYWHGELPPLGVEAIEEHAIEVTSRHVPNTLAHRDELWQRCYEDLTARLQERLQQEMNRLGGDCAHILNESVESQHNDVTGEAWLRGRFSYVLCRYAGVRQATQER